METVSNPVNLYHQIHMSSTDIGIIIFKTHTFMDL